MAGNHYDGNWRHRLTHSAPFHYLLHHQKDILWERRKRSFIRRCWYCHLIAKIYGSLDEGKGRVRLVTITQDHHFHFHHQITQDRCYTIIIICCFLIIAAWIEAWLVTFTLDHCYHHMKEEFSGWWVKNYLRILSSSSAYGIGGILFLDVVFIILSQGSVHQ